MESINPIRTDRYLYHLSSKYNRESILEHGLDTSLCENVIKRECGVFAHNSPNPSWDWFWLCMDWWDFCFYHDYMAQYESIHRRMEIYYYLNDKYDVWKIDNNIAKKEWYIDDAGWRTTECEQKDLYVYCNGAIGIEAITLCVLDKEEKEVIRRTESGVFREIYHHIIPRNEFILRYGHGPEFDLLSKINHLKSLDKTIETEELLLGVLKNKSRYAA